MPRKTRKEKIIARYRRKLELLEKSINVAEKIDSVPKIQVTKPKKTIQPNLPINNDLKKEDKAAVIYFTSDLRKTLFLVFLIIALEFFLYFATMKQNLWFF